MKTGPTLTMPLDGGLLCKGSRDINLYHTDLAVTFARVRAERAAQAEAARAEQEAQARSGNVTPMARRKGGAR